MTSAFILIDKPAGITSFKSLGSIKKQFGTKRVGHAGTLDMSASGLIVAAIGKCTRLLPYIESQEKVYTFDLHLGYSTDTLEPTGNIINDCRGNPLWLPPSANELNSVLQTFIGEIEQIPPMYSAIKINGKRASDLALKGKDVELKPRQISIYDLHIVNPDNHQSHSPDLNIIPIFCRCSKGTYIRSLARDIAEQLGTYGVAGNIRRLSIGNISLEQTYVRATLCGRPIYNDCPIPPQELFDWQVIDIDDETTKKILNGLPVISPNPIVADMVFVSHNNNIIAVAEAKNGYLIPKFQL